jgi:very-short-patch-repair endonuclease
MLDDELLALAARQHGVMALDQLRDMGRSRSAISRARSRGLIVDVAFGVVRITSSPETFRQRCMTLQLQADAVGFIGGPSAARILGLRAMPASPVNFTAPRTFRRSPPSWADLHITRWYDEDADRQVLSDGLVVAAPMRMLWGLAAVFNQYRFERAAEDAWNLGLIDPPSAAEYLERHRCRGKNGVARLDTWLERALGRSRATQSNLERRLIEALESIGLPAPERQYPLTLTNGETIHLDIAWPHVKLAVEPGDSAFHSSRQAVRRDQARDRACVELGWHVVRFDESIRTDFASAARQVARICASRRPRPGTGASGLRWAQHRRDFSDGSTGGS